MAAWKWYVYELSDQDGKVFYVGKGSGNRIDKHEEEARAGKDSHKCRKIRAILESGGRIGKNKVAYFCDEQQAYIHEADRIVEYGLDNLTNTVLATTLVSDKKKLVDVSARSFDLVKSFDKHFASWIRATDAGKKIISYRGEKPSLTAEILNVFYNDFAPRVFMQALRSDKYAQKVKDLMRKHGIELKYV